MRISLIPSAFTGACQPGDFEWEIKTQYRGKTALYIFNDNVADHRFCCPGGGSAVIRPWNRYAVMCRGAGKTLAAGVSTGMSAAQGGFQRLTAEVRSIIDADLKETSNLLLTGEYAQVVYSADPRTPVLLGTGIFNVCKDVKAYIVSQLCALVAGVREGQHATLHGSSTVEFRKIRERFLRQHKKHIQDSLSECFYGSVDLKPVPVSPAVEERFVSCYKRYCLSDPSCLVPALHGTDPSNYQSIFDRGLLVPGCGNDIAVAHGSAYGVGVYTAKLRSPSLSRDFAPRPSMLVCAVIDDACVDATVDKAHAGTTYPIKYRSPNTRKSSAKHLTDYVEDLEVWNEWDPYVSDVWGWEVDPVSGKYFEEVGPNAWDTRHPTIYSGKHVKHALDSMVIFDSSHVVPLFLATRPGLNRWPGMVYDDEVMMLMYDDEYVVVEPLPHGWHRSCSLQGFRLRVDSSFNMHWERMTTVKEVHDRLHRRGWVARHGRRPIRQCNRSDAPRSARNLHARKKIDYKQGRLALKREMHRGIADELHEARTCMLRK